MLQLLLLTLSLAVTSAKLTRVRSTAEISLTIPERSDNLELYALPVGQGDCTIIQCPNGNIIIFDCGSTGGKFRLGEEQVRAFLRNRMNDIVAVIISHPDDDHYNYLNTVLSDGTTKVNARQVIIGGTMDDYKKNRAMFDLLNYYEEREALHTVRGELSSICIGDCTVPGGTDFCEDGSTKFDILAANAGRSFNEKSIVMKITSGEFTALLPGDIEGPAANRINRDLSGELRSSLYKAAHHGAQNTPVNQNWLKNIQPTASFISSAFIGKYGHPRCDTIDSLLQNGNLDTTLPHNVTCCNDRQCKTPRKEELNVHIYETAPARDVICFLAYTSAFEYGQHCYQMEQSPKQPPM